MLFSIRRQRLVSVQVVFMKCQNNWYSAWRPIAKFVWLLGLHLPLPVALPALTLYFDSSDVTILNEYEFIWIHPTCSTLVRWLLYQGLLFGSVGRLLKTKCFDVIDEIAFTSCASFYFVRPGLWATSFIYKYETSTTYPLYETTWCFVLIN